MSFFDETKNFGLILMIVEALDLILTLFMMFVGINDVKANMIAGIGSIIATIIMIVYAFGVYSGDYIVPIDRFMNDATSKYGVLCAFVFINGVTSIIAGIFSIIGTGFASGAMSIVIGVLCIIMAFFMTDGEKNVADNIIFIVLAVIFVLMIIFGIISILAIIGIPVLIEGIMLLIMLLSPEVKEEMGMGH